MKRFCCAIIILLLTITSSAFLNTKILKISEEISYAAANKNDEKIVEIWNENYLFFSLVLKQEKTEEIQLIIDDIDNKKAPSETLKKLKNEMDGINDSMKLNLENIF
ncbi:MAG: hypothetical protein MJ120_01635 [Clostridia bacterium]|nr:hypothetical protein [Clostridia bacterium]